MTTEKFKDEQIERFAQNIIKNIEYELHESKQHLFTDERKLELISKIKEAVKNCKQPFDCLGLTSDAMWASHKAAEKFMFVLQVMET